MYHKIPVTTSFNQCVEKWFDCCRKMVNVCLDLVPVEKANFDISYNTAGPTGLLEVIIMHIRAHEVLSLVL